jgi:hypothetical protein
MEEIYSMVCMLRSCIRAVGARKGQGSLEYIMMISAVSIIIVIALAMMTQLKGSALHAFYNGSGGNLANSLTTELGNLTVK